MARMDETGDPSEADLDQIQRLVDHINTLVASAARYDLREQRNPGPEIGGGSRSLLINLYRTSMEWLPPGPVRDSVTEVLTSRDMPVPDPLRVSDELDLLDAVIGELQRVAERLLRTTQQGRRSTSLDLPGGSHPPRDQDRSGPSTGQYREKRASRPSSFPVSMLADYF
jgi:hypothetical protein